MSDGETDSYGRQNPSYDELRDENSLLKDAVEQLKFELAAWHRWWLDLDPPLDGVGEIKARFKS